MTIAKKVVEKIAAQVSSEVVADVDRRPRMDIILEGTYASLDVELGLPCPTPLRSTAEGPRSRLKSGVEEMTGLEVRRIDLRIAWLSDPGQHARSLA